MPSKNRRLSVFFLSAFLVMGSACAGGDAAEHRTLQIKGSDTMVNLGQSWAEEFMLRHPEVSIAVTGGGSGTGIASIISGTCDIAQSSRDISGEEMEKAKAKNVPVREIKVGYDGIAIIIHPSNPVSRLTLDQLADIFTGKVVNWNELGGNDQPILVLSRERNSGTHVFFLEHVLRHGTAAGPEEFGEAALMMPSNQAIVQEVKTSEGAIGYVGLGYVDEGEKMVEIGKTSEGPFVKPSVESVKSGAYPISRSLHFLLPGEPAGDVKNFIEFVLGPEGQEIVELLDFVSLNS